MRLRHKQKEASSAQTPPKDLSLKTYKPFAASTFVIGKNNLVILFDFGRTPSALSSFALTPSALAPPSSIGFAFGLRKAFASRILLRWKNAPSEEKEKTKESAEVRTFAASAFGGRRLWRSAHQ
ncbi:hypothetical protein AXG93_4093s1000 [Marchantia polymorpha subsp. ruderalis]|uniref:Uncharacterized protein n=1 Tax=Marchantia polymorpha subsp. ruderalis TaxID=1480154 RepID=A0A176VQY2_MARPO|nr:hypothetical protein AXG93_4093s1000 [Marchantia polymorpha subsp. ruderalis]